MLKYTLFALFLLLITGCGEKQKRDELFAKACEAQHTFCESLTDIPFCALPFKLSAIAYHQMKTTPVDEHAFAFLQSLDELSDCTNTAIDKQKVRKSRQSNARLSDKHSVRELQVRNQDTFIASVSSKYENLNTLEYYRQKTEREFPPTSTSSSDLLHRAWTHHNTLQALNILLERLRQGQITSPPILYSLSQHLAFERDERYLNTLYKSLEHYSADLYLPAKPSATDDDLPLHFFILRDLVKTHYQKKNYHLAYVFGQILSFNNDRSVANVDLSQYLSEEDLKRQSALDALAENIHEQLEDGEFSRS